MPKPPHQKEPSLADLRGEIDRIDEAMHALLMERGQIVERLVAVKKTEETGSAFRPAREADMMRRLVQRHRGSLPLDTVESIWRVIIATFTYVQAPFSAHADLSAGDALMRDVARFHFGFTVPLVPHLGAASVVQAVTAPKAISASSPLSPSPAPDRGGRPLSSEPRRKSLPGCRSSSAPITRPVCRSSWSRAWRPTPW